MGSPFFFAHYATPIKNYCETYIANSKILLWRLIR